MDLRKGVIVSRTNLIENKKEMAIPWKGVGVLVFVNLVLFSGAFAYREVAKRNVANLSRIVAEEKQERDYKKIAAVADSDGRLNSIGKIAGQKVNWEKVLQKMEENTLPEITFSKMDSKIEVPDQQSAAVSNSSGSEKYKLTLKGTTVGLNSLAKQILAFEGNGGKSGENFARGVSIQKIDMKRTESGEVDKGGALDFTIEIDVNPNIVKDAVNN